DEVDVARQGLDGSFFEKQAAAEISRNSSDTASDAGAYRYDGGKRDLYNELMVKFERLRPQIADTAADLAVNMLAVHFLHIDLSRSSDFQLSCTVAARESLKGRLKQRAGENMTPSEVVRHLQEGACIRLLMSQSLRNSSQTGSDEGIRVLQQAFRFPAHLYCGHEVGGDACCFEHIVQKIPPEAWYEQCRRLEETLKGRLKQPAGKNMTPSEVIRHLQEGTDGSRRFTEEITWLRQHLDQACHSAKFSNLASH
ncbi:secA, partial [Symbiodinium sp. CCMP2456]